MLGEDSEDYTVKLLNQRPGKRLNIKDTYVLYRVNVLREIKKGQGKM